MRWEAESLTPLRQHGHSENWILLYLANDLGKRGVLSFFWTIGLETRGLVAVEEHLDLHFSIARDSCSRASCLMSMRASLWRRRSAVDFVRPANFFRLPLRFLSTLMIRVSLLYTIRASKGLYSGLTRAFHRLIR